jgi:hypothetical protein
MDNQMKDRKKSKLWFIVIGLIIIAGILAGVWAFYTFENMGSTNFPFRPVRPEFNPADLEFYYVARTIFSTINLALLVILTETYAAIYIKTRSQFTIGLLIFSIVFLLKEITSSPLVIGAFRFSISGLGPFALIEPLFEMAALFVLLYLSIEY